MNSQNVETNLKSLLCTKIITYSKDFFDIQIQIKLRFIRLNLIDMHIRIEITIPPSHTKRINQFNQTKS